MRAFLKKNLSIDKVNLEKDEEVYLKGVNWGDSFNGFRYYISTKKGLSLVIDSANVEISVN